VTRRTRSLAPPRRTTQLSSRSNMGVCASKDVQDSCQLLDAASDHGNPPALSSPEAPFPPVGTPNHQEKLREPSSPPCYRTDICTSKKSCAAALARNNTGKLFDLYEIVTAPILGQGTYGTVHTVQRKDTGDLYALKHILIDARTDEEKQELRKEIEIQKGLTHPNICRLLESFEEGGNMYIIMEHCDGGSLISRMAKNRDGLSERTAATLVEKILSAVLYCHRHGVVHRDIKLDNFIYENEADDAELKLIDFGFAHEVAPGKEAMWELMLGTPSYMAPELWSHCDEEYYTSAVDMWAIGVVTFILLSGRRPFHHRNREVKRRMIRHDPLVFEGGNWEVTSEAARDFCRKLMHKEPRKRMSAALAIRHPWIRSKSNLHTGIDAAHELARHGEIVAAAEAFCASQDSFGKLALESIAFSTPPAKLEELRVAFVKMDTDDSGTISLHEFKDAMGMHPEIPPARVEKMFHDMDLNRSGDLDYLEFLAGTISTQEASKDRRRWSFAFSILDRDGDGYIGRDDILQAVDGTAYCENDVEEMLGAHGEGGLIDFKHFQAFIAHTVLGDFADDTAASDSELQSADHSSWQFEC